ncbi:VanW family protein [Effusibacillus lacus]|uniref:VanW family protein n=1 Tax=Effusibacillus lacus TaxID=1348429 RepID=A0A292YT27_9BACL|nr:VanW family protein [Effusibacillus lacus]TCS74911.1 VanW like protein [Effusibacillus lacus]GAX91584.1 VanW family protein [Effusibacillus lacus]
MNSKLMSRNRRALVLTVLFLSLTMMVSACSPLAVLAQPTVSVGEVSVNPNNNKSIERALDQLAKRYEKAPVPVRKDYDTNTILWDTPGKTLDREQTRKRIVNAKPGSKVEPVLITVPAAVQARHLASDIPAGYRNIGEFSTTLPTEKGYLANIKLASDLLNDSVVMPGETLSFNKVTGFPTADRGYQPGPGISGGQVVQMYGGGICQVSTTLFNAVTTAGLEVVERHPHSLPVSYVPIGKDAMVYIEEGKDFIFKNNRRTPVIVKSQLADGVVKVTLYGK